MSAIVRSYERSTHDHCISQNSRKAQQKSLVALLTDRNERETRTISSHRTVLRKAHRLLGQKMDLRYPRAKSLATLSSWRVCTGLRPSGCSWSSATIRRRMSPRSVDSFDSLLYRPGLLVSTAR